jgi:hypothetical protein
MLGISVSLLLLASVAPIPLDVIPKESTDITNYHPVHHVLPHPPPRVIPLDQRIARVLKQVLDSQAKETTEYWPPLLFPPVKWTQQRGLFSSFIHLNFKGSDLAAEARNLFKFVDDNGFVTSNVLESLLAARELGVEIDENVFDKAVEGILGHQDKNSLPNEIVFNFWNQVCLCVWHLCNTARLICRSSNASPKTGLQATKPFLPTFKSLLTNSLI